MKKIIVILLAFFLSASAALAVNFPDVPTDHPNFVAIESFVARGFLSGYPDGAFYPDRLINRVETLKIILNTLGVATNTYDPLAVQEFPDATEADWFWPFVQFAVQRGVMRGTDSGHLEPARAVNRAEFFKLLLVAHELYTSPRSGTEWYAPFLGLAIQTGLIVPADDPAAELTRGEVVATAYRFLQNKNVIVTQADLNAVEDAILDTLYAVQSSNPALAETNANLAVDYATSARDRLPEELATKTAYNLAQAVQHLAVALVDEGARSTAIAKAREYLVIVKTEGDDLTLQTVALIEQELDRLGE